MDEKHILELIQASAQGIPIPDSLQPEHIGQRLQTAEGQMESGRQAAGSRRWKSWRRGLLCAAAVVLCVGLATVTARYMEDGASTVSQEANMAMAADTGSMMAVEEAESAAAAPESSRATAAVEAGNLLKTDGSYLYALDNHSLRILCDEGEQLELLSELEITDDDGATLAARELYVDGDCLWVIAEAAAADNTWLLTCEISDREHPALLDRMVRDGSYVTSRSEGSYVYLVTGAYQDGAISSASGDYSGGVTDFAKLALTDGQIYTDAEATVQGVVWDASALSEQNGYLRVMTTSTTQEGKTALNLYILDEDFSLTGSLEGLASGKRLSAICFAGDRGYAAVSGDTDSLLAIDLSDPYQPELISELEWTGERSASQAADGQLDM